MAKRERYDFTAESYNERKSKELKELKKEREEEERKQKEAEALKRKQLKLERDIAEEQDRISKAEKKQREAKRATGFLGRSKRRVDGWSKEIKRLQREIKHLKK